MMEDQRRDEMRWYNERQSLKQTQAKRASSSAQARSILQSLSGGGGGTDGNDENEVDAETELAAFDRKIYVAQHEMETSFTAELKSLGVPFFGTKADLVTFESTATPAQPATDAERPKWKALITESELLTLRRRMIGHLEDLYGD